MLSILRRSLLVAVALAGVTASPAPAATTLHLSPAGSDAARCTAAAPCTTLARAYDVAQPGSEVLVDAGDYGAQSLSNLPPKANTANVVFRPATSGEVRMDVLRIDNTSNVEIRDVRAAGWRVTNSTHVVLRNIRVTHIADTGGYLSGADDVRIVGGEIGHVDPEDAIHLNAGDGHNTNIVIDGLFVHDLTRTRNGSSHNDCVQAGDVTNLRIINSRFVNCGTQGVFLNSYGGGITRDITIENTWFGPAQLGYNALYVGNAVNVLVRNNSFTHGTHIDGTGSRTSMVGNILHDRGYGCSGNAEKAAVFAYNLSAETCSGASHHRTDRGLASDFRNASAANAATFNLQLQPGSAAIDGGDPAGYPSTDFYGRRRPHGAGPDIGAVEYGATDEPRTGIAPAPPLATTPTRRGRSKNRSSSRGRGAARIRSLRAKRWRICRARRHRCRTVGVRVRVAVNRATRLRVILRRAGRNATGSRSRRTVRVHRAGVRVFKMRARRVRRGRYVLTVRPRNGRKARVRMRLLRATRPRD